MPNLEKIRQHLHFHFAQMLQEERYLKDRRQKKKGIDSELKKARRDLKRLQEAQEFTKAAGVPEKEEDRSAVRRFEFRIKQLESQKSAIDELPEFIKKYYEGKRRIGFNGFVVRCFVLLTDVWSRRKATDKEVYVWITDFLREHNYYKAKGLSYNWRDFKRIVEEYYFYDTKRMHQIERFIMHEYREWLKLPATHKLSDTPIPPVDYLNHFKSDA